MAIYVMRTEDELADLYLRHSITVYRVCFAYLKNPADTEARCDNKRWTVGRLGLTHTGAEADRVSLPLCTHTPCDCTPGMAVYDGRPHALPVCLP